MSRLPAGRARPRRRCAAVLVVALAYAVLGAPAAWAQTLLPGATTGATQEEAEPPPPALRERTREEQAVVDVALRLSALRADLLDVERDLGETAANLVAAEAALAETERALLEARTRLAEIRARLQARAVIVYQRHGDRLGMALSVDRVVDISAGSQYASSVAAVDNREVARLQGEIAALEVERAKRDATRRGLADAKGRLERRQAELQVAVEREAAVLDRLGGVPVMGTSVLTAEDLAAYFKSTGQRARLAGTTTIDDLTAMYVTEGAAENVRGDLAFAQAILETGSFGHATDNNFAGIGACDSCTSQFLFPTPRDGVRAQIQLLRNYADPTSRADRLAHPPDPTLHGTDPVRAAFLFDTFSHKGRAPVWNVMGGGNWATDPLYAGKVLGIYSRMLAFKAQTAR